MIIYRICNPQFSHDLSGFGAKLTGGRWNSRGIPLLYTGSSISLAMLEMLVHFSFHDMGLKQDILSIQVPDNAPANEISVNKLKTGWQRDTEYTAFIGDQFIRSRKHLLLKVPSVIVPEEQNFLVNPLHEDFRKVKIIRSREFEPDKRLFRV